MRKLPKYQAILAEHIAPPPELWLIDFAFSASVIHGTPMTKTAFWDECLLIAQERLLSKIELLCLYLSQRSFIRLKADFKAADKEDEESKDARRKYGLITADKIREKIVELGGMSKIYGSFAEDESAVLRRFDIFPESVDGQFFLVFKLKRSDPI